MPTMVPAAGRAVAVFEVFAREGRELSNSELARLLSLPESSTSDLLHTLQTLGYLTRTERTRRFFPSGRLLEMARQTSETGSPAIAAREAVEQLERKTHESAFFGVLDVSKQVRVIAARPSRLPLRYIIDVGSHVALHATALGKALLGELPDREARRMLRESNLRQIARNTITDIDELMDRIVAGRNRGWHETREERTEGVHGLAVCGWVGGQLVGMSLAGPAERMQKNRDSYLSAICDVRDMLMGGS